VSIVLTRAEGLARYGRTAEAIALLEREVPAFASLQQDIGPSITRHRARGVTDH